MKEQTLEKFSSLVGPLGPFGDLDQHEREEEEWLRALDGEELEDLVEYVRNPRAPCAANSLRFGLSSQGTRLRSGLWASRNYVMPEDEQELTSPPRTHIRD